MEPYAIKNSPAEIIVNFIPSELTSSFVGGV